MNNKNIVKMFVLFVLTMIVYVNAEGATDITEALDVAGKYQELARKGEWLEQSKLIIKDDLDKFKSKLISFPKFNALKVKTANELYDFILSKMSEKIKIDTLEIIDSVKESEELVHVITRSTIIMQNDKYSGTKLLTLKYLDNVWKISAEEKLNNIINTLKIHSFESQRLEQKTQMQGQGKLRTQTLDMKESGMQKSETKKPEMQEPEIQN